MKAQNNNSVKPEVGNSTKPLLSSRLLKFRAFSNETKKMMDWDFIKSVNNLTKLISLNHVDVSEFIGLHDKNGKEIYEGDILCEYRLDGKHSRPQLVTHCLNGVPGSPSET